MKTIWKFQFAIADRVAINMPARATVLHVDLQHGVPTLWALVDNALPQEAREFRIFGTGHPVDLATIRHVGTIQDGDLVWHVFETS